MEILVLSLVILTLLTRGTVKSRRNRARRNALQDRGRRRKRLGA